MPGNRAVPAHVLMALTIASDTFMTQGTQHQSCSNIIQQTAAEGSELPRVCLGRSRPIGQFAAEHDEIVLIRCSSATVYDVLHCKYKLVRASTPSRYHISPDDVIDHSSQSFCLSYPR